jgi:hypothetical protein
MQDESPGNLTLEIPPVIIDRWQETVDLLAEVVDVPAALVMRVEDPRISVLVASASEGNPYHPGESEEVWGSGLYCETVIRNRERLLVPDATADPAWDHNPDIKLGMISYLGFPVSLPDGSVFGTICVLDRRPTAYTDNVSRLMAKMRDLIEADLELIFVNQRLGDEKRRIADYLEELLAFRGIVPICAGCKSIRDDGGEWRPIEEYLLRHPTADFTHGMCPSCMERLYPGLGENH